MWFDTELQPLMTNADQILTCLGLAQIFWPPYHPHALRGIEGFVHICIIRQIKAVFFQEYIRHKANLIDTKSIAGPLVCFMGYLIFVF